MIFKAKYEIFACHFNDREDPSRMPELLADCWDLIHGHNFLIDVEITGAIDRSGVVVDERELSEVVNQFNHTILSLHPLCVKTALDLGLSEHHAGRLEVFTAAVLRRIRHIVNTGDVRVRVYETANMYSEESL